MDTGGSTLGFNKELAARFLRLATKYRVHECLALMTPEATWWVNGERGRLKVAGLKDRVQIGRLLEGVQQFIPVPMQLSVTGVIAEGSRVALEAECQGISRNGSPYHNRYHFLFEVRDGLIASVREYMDTLHLHDTLQRETTDRKLEPPSAT